LLIRSAERFGESRSD